MTAALCGGLSAEGVRASWWLFSRLCALSRARQPFLGDRISARKSNRISCSRFTVPHIPDGVKMGSDPPIEAREPPLSSPRPAPNPPTLSLAPRASASPSKRPQASQEPDYSDPCFGVTEFGQGGECCSAIISAPTTAEALTQWALDLGLYLRNKRAKLQHQAAVDDQGRPQIFQGLSIYVSCTASQHAEGDTDARLADQRAHPSSYATSALSDDLPARRSLLPLSRQEEPCHAHRRFAAYAEQGRGVQEVQVEGRSSRMDH